MGYLTGPYHYEGPAAPGYGVTGTLEFESWAPFEVMGGVLVTTP